MSIGNLTFGGTGKTPFVVHVCRELQARGRRPGILSRGYKALGPEGNDEALLLARALPGVPHAQDPDRLRGGASLAGDVDAYVLDDGFQHLPLHRDADVVLIDLTDPFGGGACPPGGRLREPVSALARAHLVVLTRAELVDGETLGDTMRRVRAHTEAPVAVAAFAARCDADLTGARVHVACGIGNPRAFVATVERLGAEVAGTTFFRDHHAYGAADAARLGGAGAPVVVTGKDAVKLAPLWPEGAPPLHVVEIDVEMRDGAADLAALLDRL